MIKYLSILGMIVFISFLGYAIISSTSAPTRHAHNSHADMVLNCSREARLNAAELHYKAGCLIEAIKFCNGFVEEDIRNSCNDKYLGICEEDSKAYRVFLNTGRGE